MYKLNVYGIVPRYPMEYFSRAIEKGVNEIKKSHTIGNWFPMREVSEVSESDTIGRKV
jgi:hypothetical protein